MSKVKAINRKKRIISGKEDFYSRVKQIIESARKNIARSINYEMVCAYWLIGKEIVEEEQKGKARAGYGEALMENLSHRLSNDCGKGWSMSHLWHVRQFYLTYRNRSMLHTPCAELKKGGILHTLSAELSWSHYRILMRVEKENARNFYEIECIRNRWSVRELERQKGSLLYERLALSKDKKGLMLLAKKGQKIESYKDIVKDPYVLEFLDISAEPKLYESKLEQALIDNLSKFLLELGRGFTFVARQKRITLDGDHFFIDIVFYNTILKCYVLIDLKIGKLTHQDIGQMQMYVNYYNRKLIQKDDNPTVGLVLCEDKKEAVVRYTLSRENKQIFASRYKLYLPTEKELADEIKKDRLLLENRYRK